MEVLKIKIQSLEDVRKGEKVIDGMEPENTEISKDITACILEAGMMNGATSLMFVTKTRRGNHVVFELTPTLFEQLYSVFKGAQERFGK